MAGDGVGLSGMVAKWTSGDFGGADRKPGEEVEEAGRVPAEISASLVIFEFVEEENAFFDFGGSGRFGLSSLEPELFGQPVLVFGFAPAREVVFVEVFTDVAEGGDDSFGGKAVLEHEVDAVADGLGEPGDLARVAGVEPGVCLRIEN